MNVAVRFFQIAFIGALLFLIVVAGTLAASWIKETFWFHVSSHVGPFQLTILDLKSQPGYFSEHVRVKCARDMTAKVWVADLKDAGIFPVHGSHGENYYRDGDPAKIIQGMDVSEDNGFSTCDILYRIQTTSTNTLWYDKLSVPETTNHVEDYVSGNNKLPVPLAVTGVQTNWPGSYEIDSEIPLANLGEYKVLLSIK